MSNVGSGTTLGPWREVAPGVHRLVAEPDAVNLTLIEGAERCLLVDCGSTPAQGHALADAVRRRTDAELAAVVVTHRHRDHWFGLAAFDGVESIGHESLAQRRPDDLAEAARLGLTEADLCTPSRIISTVGGLDLGGRWVEFTHLGVGHTDGDVVVVVPDARLVVAGDLLESPGVPQFGPDSDPKAWATTADHLVGLTQKGGYRALPGHGELMDAQSVLEQRARIGGIEVVCRRLIEDGVPLADALAAGDWPFPATGLEHAVASMYRQLGELGLVPRRTLPIRGLD